MPGLKAPAYLRGNGKGGSSFARMIHLGDDETVAKLGRQSVGWVRVVSSHPSRWDCEGWGTRALQPLLWSERLDRWGRMAGMKNLNRRELCVALSALAAVGSVAPKAEAQAKTNDV